MRLFHGPEIKDFRRKEKMTCIFGFGTHDFRPCDLLMADELHLLDVVCPSSKRRLRSQYNAFLNDKNASAGWDADFLEFIDDCLNVQLHEICVNYSKSCSFGLAAKESKIVDEKFGKICDNYMTYG